MVLAMAVPKASKFRVDSLAGIAELDIDTLSRSAGIR